MFQHTKLMQDLGLMTSRNESMQPGETL